MTERYRRILVPVDVEHDDGMGNAAVALDLARRIGADGAKLLAVGVVPNNGELARVFYDRWRQLMTRARNQLDLLVVAGIDDGEDMEAHLLIHDDVANEVIRAAERLEADTIVIPSHRRHGLSRLSPSVAEKISRDAPMDVVLLRLAE